MVDYYTFQISKNKGTEGRSVGECLTRDQGDRGCGPHWRHCVVSLSKTHVSLLSTGSTQEDLTDDWDVLKNQIKQKNQTKVLIRLTDISNKI